MARWHHGSCFSPRVWVDQDTVPQCSTCGSSAREQLQKLVQTSSSIPPVPPNEPAGQLNLSWPSTVSYVRTNQENDKRLDPTASADQPPKAKSESPQRLTPAGCKPGSFANLSSFYENTLRADQFRLVCLTDNDNNFPDDIVHVSLETFEDQKSPEYEAVSYSWGGEDGNDSLRHPIYVGDYWDILLQTQNCRAMLSYLRPLNGTRMLWVDAICINQQNLEERSNQVTKMGRIYSECFQVVLWLGEDVVSKRPTGHPTKHRFQQLHDPTLTLLFKNGRQVTIQEILKRRYFSRVWVIQELILPPRILVPFGDKTFWVGPSMNADLQHQTNGNWSWEQTKAPWFQLATQGMLSTKSLPDMLNLGWKSQSSDVRDKIYGILGPLALNPIASCIKPDYSISLQHTLIGLFSHLIIHGNSPQQLLKASGASADANMPSWMPRWGESDAWKGLFGNETGAVPAWDTVKKSLEDCIMNVDAWAPSLNIPKDPLLSSDRLIRFLPVPTSEANGLRSAFNDRPWYKNATVDANSGSLTLYLTRFSSISRVPIRVGSTHAGWYCYSAGKHAGDFVWLMSQSPLDTIVRTGDSIFLLDTDVSEPIYLILRQTNDNDKFRLIATCSHLVIHTLHHSGSLHARSLDRGEKNILPIAYLQTSLAEDLTRLHVELDKLVCFPGDYRFTRYCFPGIERDLLLRDALPLFLVLENDDSRKRPRTPRTFEHAYLSLLGSRYQPRITDGICELSVELTEADKLLSLISSHEALPILGWQPWEKQPSTEDKSKVILRRSVERIEDEVEHILERVMPEWMPDWRLPWLSAVLGKLVDEGIEERIMEKPRAEDYFQGGTHIVNELDGSLIGEEWMYESFHLDGSTNQVCIIEGGTFEAESCAVVGTVKTIFPFAQAPRVL